MSKTTVALVVKFLMTLLFAALAFRAVGSSWRWLFILAAAGTALNYLLGDLMVLPAFGNIIASLADGLLAAVTAYVIDRLTPAFDTTFSTLLLFALLIAVGEYFFHRYLAASEKVAP